MQNLLREYTTHLPVSPGARGRGVVGPDCGPHDAHVCTNTPSYRGAGSIFKPARLLGEGLLSKESSSRRANILHFHPSSAAPSEAAGSGHAALHLGGSSLWTAFSCMLRKARRPQGVAPLLNLGFLVPPVFITYLSKNKTKEKNTS